MTPKMTRLVKSLYKSTLCFASAASRAASAVPGSTTPVVLGFIALPGTVLLSCCEERAAESLLERALFSLCADARESVSFLFSVARRTDSLEAERSSFFRSVRSEVRDWRSETCCLRALMMASWSGGSVSAAKVWEMLSRTYPLLSDRFAS